MFLIKCYDDNRVYIIDNDNIECEGKQKCEIVKNDVVTFTIKKKRYEGTVIEYSSNSEYLTSQRKKFNTANIKKDDQEVSVDRGKLKRKIIPKRSWSPEASPPSKKSRLTNTKQPVTNAGTLKKNKKSVQMNESSDSSISSQISSDDSNVSNGLLVQDIDKPFLSKEKNISPSKDDLKKQLEMLMAEKNEPTKTANEISPQTSGTSPLIPRNRNTKESQHKKLLETKNEIGDIYLISYIWWYIPPKITASEKNKVDNTDTFDSVDEEIENVEQLFPSDYDSGKMKHIGNNIYCRQIIYQSAIGASHKATHLARRLLEGVFTHETLMSCTLTGQAPRSKDKTVNVIMPLNQRAKDAIVDFAMKIAVEKKWPLQTRLTILRVMSQKLTEYKRDNKKDKPDVES